MMSSSAVSLWLGVYATERHHELMLTGKPPGLVRVIALGMKTCCELIVPIIGLVLYILAYNLQVKLHIICRFLTSFAICSVYMFIPELKNRKKLLFLVLYSIEHILLVILVKSSVYTYFTAML